MMKSNSRLHRSSFTRVLAYIIFIGHIGSRWLQSCEDLGKLHPALDEINMMNWLPFLTGSVDDSPAEHTNVSPAKARASAMTVLVDIFDEFNSGDNPEVTIEGRVLSCKSSEEAVQEQGGRQVLQRLRAAVTELHEDGVLTSALWFLTGLVCAAYVHEALR